MQHDTALARFCNEYYGTVKAASEILEIPYQTLLNNCRNPRRGWVHVNKMVDRFMSENEALKEKVRFLNDQYAHLADEYNAVVRKYEEEVNKGEPL